MLEERAPTDFTSDEGVVCALLPHRDVITERWRAEIEPLVDTSLVGGGWEANIAGSVFEFAIGFDLATAVPYRDALGILQPASCQQLLTTLGFEPNYRNGLSCGALDFDAWQRSTASPMLLAEVLPAASCVEQIYRIMAKLDIEQGWFENQLGPPHEYTGRRDAARLVTRLWNDYLESGREQLLRAGELVAARPRFHDRAIGDLILGQTLVDIKAKVNPLIDLDGDFVQLLRYVLFDQANAYDLKAVMLYFGYQAAVVQQPIAPVLADLVGDTSASIDALRREFARLLLSGT